MWERAAFGVPSTRCYFNGRSYWHDYGRCTVLHDTRQSIDPRTDCGVCSPPAIQTEVSSCCGPVFLDTGNSLVTWKVSSPSVHVRRGSRPRVLVSSQTAACFFYTRTVSTEDQFGLTSRQSLPAPNPICCSDLVGPPSQTARPRSVSNTPLSNPGLWH